MKKILLTILMSIGVLTVYSQVMLPTHYDSEHTAKHIIKGHLKMYLMDSVKVVTEKKNERYITDYGIDPDRVKAKVDKILAKGKPEYNSRTNGGYIFTIIITDCEDDIKIINYVIFHIDAFTQKIKEIEILLGE
jgi:hypothetical protein